MFSKQDEDSSGSQEKLGLLGGPSRDVSIETISMSVSNSNAENSQIIPPVQPETQRKRPKIREKVKITFVISYEKKS